MTPRWSMRIPRAGDCDLRPVRRPHRPRRAEVEAGTPATYKDFEKVLNSDVDAVVIATPPFEHPRMLGAAVQAGKHVDREKPAGVDLEGCKKVMAIGREANPAKRPLRLSAALRPGLPGGVQAVEQETSELDQLAWLLDRYQPLPAGGYASEGGSSRAASVTAIIR